MGENCYIELFVNVIKNVHFSTTKFWVYGTQNIIYATCDSRTMTASHDKLPTINIKQKPKSLNMTYEMRTF